MRFHRNHEEKNTRLTAARAPRRLFPWLLLFAFSLLPLSATANVVARASVEKPSMTQGQSNAYRITLQNAGQSFAISPPTVPGLRFAPNASSNTSVRSFNGQASTETTLSWAFQAEAVGRYVIPARDITVRGETIRINAVTVEVTEMSEAMRNRFFLRWFVPGDSFYVGQAIPATLQLYVRGDMQASLGSAPEGSSDQFLLAPFSGQPRQSQGQVEGQPFIMVEWDTVITPIRSGPGDLPASLVLVYETGGVRRDIFGRAVQNQDHIRLTTDSTDWTILDLPRANRPPSFSGAVGQFEVTSKLSATEAEAGDPLTFTLEVAGEGSFDRIQAPEIPEIDGWRIYPPRTQMREEEEEPTRGVKTFEYIFSPTRESVEELPPVAFSWFDPKQEVWEERVLGSDPVRIRPGSGPSPQPRTPQTDRPASDPPGKPGLFPLAQTPGNSGSLSIPWKQPLFWIVNGGMTLLATVALFGVVRQQRSAQNPYLQLRSEATRKGRELATQAVKAAHRQDAPEFYLQATQSLRHFLAFLDPQSHNPESLTWNDLESILQKFSFDENSLAQAHTLFKRQDAVHFAGWKPGNDELAHDRQSFETVLNQIARRKR